MIDEGFATVFESPDCLELGLAKSLLDEAGIASAVPGGSASALLGTLLGSSGCGVQCLVVSREQEEQALGILEAAFGGGAKEPPFPDGAVV